MWRTMVAADGAVVVCDGPEIPEIVGMYLDLRLTVPGGVVLPAAGVSWVAVAPTHRRRGLLREMFEELHRRMVGARYPVAALLASEGGIYGRFGYGPATIKHRLRVERRWAQVHPDDPVRVVSEHASLEECREHADRENRIVAEVLARSAERGEKPYDIIFQNPFLCMPQGHVPRPRRQ